MKEELTNSRIVALGKHLQSRRETGGSMHLTEYDMDTLEMLLTTVQEVARKEWRAAVLKALESDSDANHLVFDVLRGEFDFMPEGGLFGAIKSTFGEYDTPSEAAQSIVKLYLEAK